MELEIMNEETTGNQQKLPLVVGVDLGGTQIVPKSWSFSDSQLMELPAGLHGKQQFVR
jgi:hypothetical protein